MALERLITVKVILIGGFFIVALALVVKGDTWAELPQAVTSFGQFPAELGFALMMGAIAYAGAGGGQNLCQSNWIRDKGFGMGIHVPSLVSPITGEKHAARFVGGVRVPRHPGEPGPLAAVVEVRQRRAAVDVRADHHPDHHRDLACWP